MGAIERVKSVLNRSAKARTAAEKAASDLHDELAAVRGTIAEKEGELAAVARMPVDPEEVLRRWHALVDNTAAAFRQRHGTGPMSACRSPTFGDQHNRPAWPDPAQPRDDFHGYMCLFFGEELKARGAELLEEGGGEATITFPDRIARTTALQAELDELLKAEAAIITSAAAMGIEIAERPKVKADRASAESDARHVRSRAANIYKQACARLELLDEAERGRVRGVLQQAKRREPTEHQLRERAKNERIAAIYKACERAGALDRFEKLVKDRSVTADNIAARLAE